MALPRNFRFPVEFGCAFPDGVLVTSEVEVATERQSQEDRQRGREPRQRVDMDTGFPVWRVTVSDPAALRRAEASVTVELMAAQAPVLPDPVPGLAMPVREVEFTGLTAEPRLGGQGEFRYLTFAYRASGLRAPEKAGGAASAGGRSSGRSGSASSGESPGGK